MFAFLLSNKELFIISDRCCDDIRGGVDQAPILGISVIARVPLGMELMLGYQWFKREYDAAPLLYESDREDTRHTFRAALSQRVYEHLFWSLDFGYINNDSNADLCTFDQTTFSMNIGVLF